MMPKAQRICLSTATIQDLAVTQYRAFAFAAGSMLDPRWRDKKALVSRCHSSSKPRNASWSSSSFASCISEVKSRNICGCHCEFGTLVVGRRNPPGRWGLRKRLLNKTRLTPFSQKKTFM